MRVTGFFGVHTLRAVERFQRRHGLLVDGQVGPHTRHALRTGWLAHVARVRFHRQARDTRRDLGGDMLSIGSRGSRVAEAQRLLHIRADGIFGPQTRAAVLRFQRRHGLPAVGWVGPHTRHALLIAWRRSHVPARHHHRRHAARRHRARRARHRHAEPAVFRLGMRGVRVAELQVRLGLAADGVFGPAMAAAVERFQGRHGLSADGQIGPRTLRAMHLSHWGRLPFVRAAVEAVGEVGTPYVFGGASPGGFDCSGLVMWAYARAGVALPRTSFEQFRDARSHPPLRGLRTGDLVFFDGAGHVGMYLGHHLIVRAPRPGARVGITRLSGWFLRHWSGAGRV
ncbi:MAG: C40 family peptidase [Gaiellales bacterium]